jgi:hypothetical protein
MIWHQFQRHLAARSFSELGSEEEHVLLFCTRSLTMVQAGVLYESPFCSFLCFYHHHGPEGGHGAIVYQS